MLCGSVGVRIPRRWLSPRRKANKFCFGLLGLLRCERVDPAITCFSLREFVALCELDAMLCGSVGVRIPRRWLSPRHKATKFCFGLLGLLRCERVYPAITCFSLRDTVAL